MTTSPADLHVAVPHCRARVVPRCTPVMVRYLEVRAAD